MGIPSNLFYAAVEHRFVPFFSAVGALHYIVVFNPFFLPDVLV